MIDIVLSYGEEGRDLAELLAALGWETGTQEDWFKTRCSCSGVHSVGGDTCARKLPRH